MFEDYGNQYSESGIMNKLYKILGLISSTALRKILTLVIMLQHDNVPTWAKIAIVGTLGYLICPIDLFPDFLPGGLLDDLAAISALLIEISTYKTDDIETEVDEMMDKF
jgi:uncharacterized membrane protein YkvA (DUF1232 family)